MKIAAVIMAGGRGERFWPESRQARPKQFLSLTEDGETLIQKTVNRLSGLTEKEDIFIVTGRQYTGLIREQLPDIPEENIIPEPVSRNTAPCIGLAAGIIRKKYGGETVMAVLPSDHLIKMNAMFTDTLRLAAKSAMQGKSLVTIGIPPAYPETGYGYINFDGSRSAEMGAYQVKRFVEKPDREKAKQYVSSGEYLWNSGIFVWKASSILENIGKFLPEMHSILERITDTWGTGEFDRTLEDCFPLIKGESIDFGVMEKAEDIYTVPGSFGWDDAGSWLAMERINPTNEFGNVVRGDVVSINTTHSTVMGGKRLIATVGIDDLIIVDADDALLICGKEHAQEVKRVIDHLKICNRERLL